MKRERRIIIVAGPNGAGRRFAIITSRFNELITARLTWAKDDDYHALLYHC